MEIMREFKITSTHDIYVDCYINGELYNVNFYILKGEVKAETIDEAIEEYFDKHLFYKFDKNLSQIDEESNELYYTVLVDSVNAEASESEIEEWKRGKLDLYSNNIAITIQEIVNVSL